ncbi:flagellar hook-associated protein FlgK [Acidiphilium acidophilum]|uniref:Flagellar hook-associated protein 1 n=1 Tax=Acidiphilium acidophilum TaxID=76588 RepID=A0AAW9DLW1_ACIAO|nr:flagellar hook-associated protein FlgK [Acidiphilium acidophilum]MDX5929901.1 flagellar hook-associated protein FlgK [Acidiphilium acidophilum]GBR75015.1 flagellar hook-associated protein FlgK [Acidiphilium acidophilum DSM 700]
MSIASGLSIANSGLAAIEAQLSVVSQNVANANTAGYSAESVSLTATSAQGLGTGVSAGPAIQLVNTSIQSQLNASVADQSFQQTTASALTGIDQVMGTPGQGNDLSSLLGNLQSGFTTLLSDPGNTVQQSAVVGTAQNLSNQINTIASALGSAVTTSQGNVVAGIKSLNASLTQVGTLNNQIISLAQQGRSTADLQNQRDALVQTIAGLTGAKLIAQPTGAIALYTPSGLQLPTSGAPQLSVSGTGAVMLGTRNVTASITTGSIGANLELASSTLPDLQSGLDNVAATLANSFTASGLTLFTPAGASATAASGFSSQITVNPAVTQNPALIRDGTPANVNTSGDAGFTGLIGTILSNTLNGSTGTLATTTTGFTAQEASVSSAAQTASTAATSLTSALTTQASTTSGVSVDQQMGLLVTLQNAYAANAKVVSIAQQMWQTEEAMIS